MAMPSLRFARLIVLCRSEAYISASLIKAILSSGYSKPLLMRTGSAQALPFGSALSVSSV